MTKSMDDIKLPPPYRPDPATTIPPVQESTGPRRGTPIPITSGIHVAGPYDLTKADSSSGKVDAEEKVMVYVAAVMAVVATALIFVPTMGVERQATFAAGLSLFGAAATTATRAVSKGGKK